jgi:hypothetical protein
VEEREPPPLSSADDEEMSFLNIAERAFMDKGPFEASLWGAELSPPEKEEEGRKGVGISLGWGSTKGSASNCRCCRRCTSSDITLSRSRPLPLVPLSVCIGGTTWVGKFSDSQRPVGG